MAIVTKRYLFRGPCLTALRRATDPGLTLPEPDYGIFRDVSFDDSVASEEAVDTGMDLCGFVPDPFDTNGLQPTPFLGLISPDSSVWKISVDNAGVLSTTKVTP